MISVSVRQSASNRSVTDRSRLQILSKRLVTSIFAGAYSSVFRGRGLEFEELREYQPGDDIRCIDWNVTARSDRPFIKRFVEEREMTVMLLLDRSASLECPSPRRSKSLVAAEICALLTSAAVRSNDRVGLMTFTNRVERFIPPGKGKRHAQRLIAEIEVQPVATGSTDLACALDYLQRVIRRNVILFIVSDFISGDFQLLLAAAARRHDVVAVAISDPHDQQLPDVGLFQVADAETGSRHLIDTGSPLVRQTYAAHAAHQREKLAKTIADAGAELLTVSTNTPPVQALSRFFQSRQRSLRR